MTSTLFQCKHAKHMWFAICIVRVTKRVPLPFESSLFCFSRTCFLSYVSLSRLGRLLSDYACAAQPPPQTCMCWSLSPELINSLTSKNWESEGSQHYWCLFFWLLLLSLHSWESAGAFSFWRYFPTSWQYSQLGFFSAVSPARTSTDKCYHWLYWHGPQRDIRWRHFWNSSP